MFGDNGSTRKWQCFVCGQNYNSYEEYKSHILEKHDEGREYIKCPGCDAPVRDLKTHFSLKHPKIPIPSGIQTRVAVWHEFKAGASGGKKTGVRKPNFRRGSFASKKCNCDFEYRSGMECDFYECLEGDRDVIGWSYESVKVPYFWQNSWHNYIVDLKVIFCDGSVQLWEIKPANQTTLEQNQAKWASANNFCSNLGWEFVVMTEVGLGKLRAKIQRQRAMLLE